MDRGSHRFGGVKRFPSVSTRCLDRLYLLSALTASVAKPPGDTAECGVYGGISLGVTCHRLVGTGNTNHGFDSFTGLSSPAPEDGAYWSKGDLTSTFDTAKAALAEFPNVRLWKGWIPEHFDEVQDPSFCLVHIDVDLYQPTLDSLSFFYDRTVDGGVTVCGDYGFSTCQGARQAMTEFLGDRGEVVVEVPTGQGLVIKVWPDRAGRKVTSARSDVARPF